MNRTAIGGILAAAMMGIGGCSFSLSLGNGAGSAPPAPVTVPVAQPVLHEPEDVFPDSRCAQALGRDLNLLAATNRDGHLTDAENKQARTVAMAEFDNRMKHRNLSASGLHDEIGFLTHLRTKNAVSGIIGPTVLSEEEFVHAKATVLKQYGPSTRGSD